MRVPKQVFFSRTKLTVAVVSILLIMNGRNCVKAAAMHAVPKRKNGLTLLASSMTRNKASTGGSSSMHENREQWIPEDWVDRPRGGASAASSFSAELFGAGVSATADAGFPVLEIIGIAAVAATCKECAGRIAKFVSDQADTGKFLLAGAVAGIVSKTVISPLEVVSTLQMTNVGTEAVKRSLPSQLGALWQQEGMAGFFKGNLANCLKVAPTRAIQFFVFEGLKQRLMEHKLREKKARLSLVPTVEGTTAAAAAAAEEVSLNPFERLVAGGMAGMVASSIVYPLEVVKTVLTLYPGQSIPAVFRQVLSQGGVKALYAGLKPTLIAMFPYVGVEFMIYETAKIAIEKVLPANEDGSCSTLPVVLSLAIGAVAGAAAQTAAHPFDVVRKRLQVQGMGSASQVLYRGSRDCFQRIANTEGWQSLYKGLRPACIATLPGTGMAYVTYEWMKQVLGLCSL